MPAVAVGVLDAEGGQERGGESNAGVRIGDGEIRRAEHEVGRIAGPLAGTRRARVRPVGEIVPGVRRRRRRLADVLIDGRSGGSRRADAAIGAGRVGDGVVAAVVAVQVLERVLAGGGLESLGAFPAPELQPLKV